MKIRKGYVSNSSSSSFIIECKGQKLANYVKESYGKCFDLWMELNPNYKGYGLNRCNYEIVSIEKILEHFKDYCMKPEDIKYYKECLKNEEKEGYFFLLGSCTSEDCTPEYKIMEVFNDYFLECLKGKYNWEKGKYENDICMFFNTRWS